MIDHLLFVYAFNLRHARHLVEGLTPEQGVAQPGGLVNHVAWSIGHLALTSDVVAMELGQAQGFPPEWMERFFPGMPITGDVDAYPPLADLLAQRNPTCNSRQYAGGLRCCGHKRIMLDADQPVRPDARPPSSTASASTSAITTSSSIP